VSSNDNSNPSRGSVRFLLDGERIELDDVTPTRTVLQFLREDLGRSGTKEGCAEGDCGACTVVVGERDAQGRLRLGAVNACIRFLPTLDGLELFTVESLRGSNGTLHPVQQAMVDCHGSQCGFCTPGFVMSLFALYKTRADVSRVDADHALAGNLCRCTGYRPIIDAAKAMYGYPADDADWLRQPASAGSAGDRERARRLAALDDGSELAIPAQGGAFFAPRSLARLAALVEQHPDATLLAGATDVGLWVTKQHRDLGTVISTLRVPELCRIDVDDQYIRLGAAVTLTEAMPVLTEHYPQLEELLLRYGSPPIRNAATVGGNVANGSPIGDSMPALMALDARLTLRQGSATRDVSLDAFYTGYQATVLRQGEFLESIRIPLPVPADRFRSWKVSKRFDQDISAVCAAFRVRLEDGRVSEARVAFGGMAAMPMRASGCEQALLGRPLTEAGITDALAALDRDFSPISDMRASETYRRRVCANLLRRFALPAAEPAAEGLYAYGRAEA